MILVNQAVLQMNVLKNNQLLIFCELNRDAATAQGCSSNYYRYLFIF